MYLGERDRERQIYRINWSSKRNAQPFGTVNSLFLSSLTIYHHFQIRREQKKPGVFQILRDGGGDDRLRSLRLLPTHRAGHCGLSPDGAFGRKGTPGLFGPLEVFFGGGCPGPVPFVSSQMSSVSSMKTNNSCTDRPLYWWCLVLPHVQTSSTDPWHPWCVSFAGSIAGPILIHFNWDNPRICLGKTRLSCTQMFALVNPLTKRTENS